MATSQNTYFERICSRVASGPQLSEEEERDLARRFRVMGDRSAADRLVELHLPLVLRLSRRLRGYGVSPDELISEGNIGLMKAVEKFDTRGVRFKTYATYWVRAYMLAYILRTTSIVTQATGALGARLFFRLRAARARAEALLGPGHDSIDGRLAEQFGVSEEVIRKHTARLGSSDLSLDAPVGEDGDGAVVDLMASPDASPEDRAQRLERDELVATTLQRMWLGLNERERAVLTHRLLDDDGEVTLADLGERFQLSRERLRQIEVRVKGRLKHALEAAGAATQGPEDPPVPPPSPGP